MNIRGKSMNSEGYIRKALSMCLTVAIIAAYSMTTLAGTDKIAGQLLISGTSANGEVSFVKVNGKAAQSGSQVLSSSTVATPEDASAVIDLGKIGKIELAPKTTLAGLTFGEKGISGNLLAGQVTVLSAAQSVNMTTLDGKITKLNAGESLNAGKKQDDDDDNKGGGWALWAALIIGGAVAAIIIAATRNDNSASLGGGTVVASPSR